MFVNEPDVGAAVDYVAHNPQTRSQLCVPVYVEGRVIGIVNLESPALHAYDAWIDIAQATAAHIGLAVANARLALATVIQEQARETLRRAHGLKRGLLTLPWVGERWVHRGSGGHWPASDSIASAISASGLWKP